MCIRDSACTDLMMSKTFDNGMICASEQAVIVDEAIAKDFEDYMKAVSYTHLDVYKRQTQADVQPYFSVTSQAVQQLGMRQAVTHAAQPKGCLLYTSRCV